MFLLSNYCILGSRKSNLSPPFKRRLTGPRVALTRERGKNILLRELLANVNCVEIPCIVHEIGQDTISRQDMLQNDVVVVSSPQVGTSHISSRRFMTKSFSGC